MGMGYSSTELETIITRAADQKLWHVFSEDPSMIRKLTKQYGPGKPVACGSGLEWEVPKTKISFRNLAPRKLSQAQVDNLAKGRQVRDHGLEG